MKTVLIILALLAAGWMISASIKASESKKLCQEAAFNSYLADWDLSCSHLGQSPRCVLPDWANEVVLGRLEAFLKDCK